MENRCGGGKVKKRRRITKKVLRCEGVEIVIDFNVQEKSLGALVLIFSFNLDLFRLTTRKFNSETHFIGQETRHSYHLLS